MAAATAASGFVEGVPCWVDVMLSDLAAGKRFYGELFDWTFGEPAPAEQGFYTPAHRRGQRVAALSRKSDGRLPTVWTLYLATQDAAATLGRVRRAGGQVVMAPTPVGEYGTVASAVDPGGALFGLWQPGTHEGFEAQVEPGSFVWTEVHTRERAVVDAFYAEVFGYGMRPLAVDGGEPPSAGSFTAEPPTAEPETHPARSTPNGDFMIWAPAGQPVDEEHAIGGRAVLSPGQPAQLPAHFLVYFSVTDCDDAIQTALRLGGRLRHEPRTSRFGRFALLVDNQGAEFAVIDVETTDDLPG